MNEFTAALGLVQAERLDEIVAWKNQIARSGSTPCIPGVCGCPTAWSPGSTSTSCSTRSSDRPARSTTSPATGSWVTTSTCPTATGSPRTIGACRSTTHRVPDPMTARCGRRSRMRILVTGGAGFIGSHVVDKLLAAGRAADLRPRPVAVARAGTHRIGDLLDPGARAPRCAVATPFFTSRPWPTSRGGRQPSEPSGSTPRHPERARGRPGRRRGARRLRAHDLGVHGESGEPGRRGHAAGPPGHLYTATEDRGRDVLPAPTRALRAGVHDPALRDPLRPARAGGRGRADLRRQGPRRRAADDRGGRIAVPALRLRRGPGRGRRGRARPRVRAASTTSWATAT